MDRSVFEWSEEKNILLVKERNISFEEVAFALENGKLLDIIMSPTHEGQRCFVVEIRAYAYVVPYMKGGRGDDISKNGLPKQKIYETSTKGEQMKKHTIESEAERALLDEVEKGAFVSLPKEAFEREKALLTKAAANTIEKRKKKKSYNIRLFEHDVETIKALSETAPHFV